MDEGNSSLADKTGYLEDILLVLQKNYEVLNAVLEGTSDSIFVKDSEGMYLLVNSACSKLLGKSRASITPQLLATGVLSQQTRMNLIQHLMDDCFKESSVQSGTKLRMIQAQLAGILGLSISA